LPAVQTADFFFAACGAFDVMCQGKLLKRERTKGAASRRKPAPAIGDTPSTAEPSRHVRTLARKLRISTKEAKALLNKVSRH